MFLINNNNICIYFGQGNFDKYCVFVNCPSHFKYAPTDDVYFKWLLKLSKQYGVDIVWDDFNRIYNIVGDDIEEDLALKTITMIDKHYNEDTIMWWLVFYMTMIAEQKKENAILKKRIKRLGVYNILFDHYDIDYVITYMKGTNWRTLAKMMKERGIC